MKSHLVIGLMSGTSLDGVDTALVDFSTPRPVVLATHFAPFEEPLRQELLALQTNGRDELERAALAANGLVNAYASGVSAVLRASGTPASAVRAIGAHGQTVRHRPESGFTIQLNNPALLAELTGIAVVADFRSRDVAAGGQGAPLAPAFHQAFFGAREGWRAVVNIGGIANVTLLGPNGEVSGFDTGPGNVFLDAWCLSHTGQAFDDSGAWAKSGKVVPGLLVEMLAEPYFGRPTPKSTGRDLFNDRWLSTRLGQAAVDLHPVDVQATLLELTARSICNVLAGRKVDGVFVCGGGARNVCLMQRLQDLMGKTPVTSTASLGVPPDWVEAVAFAWFALLAIDGATADLQTVTGAKGPRVLGAVYHA